MITIKGKEETYRVLYEEEGTSIRYFIFETNLRSIAEEYRRYTNRLLEEQKQYQPKTDVQYTISFTFQALFHLMQKIIKTYQIPGIQLFADGEQTWKMDSVKPNYTPPKQYKIFIEKTIESAIHVLYVDLFQKEDATLEEIVEKIAESLFSSMNHEIQLFYEGKITREEFMKRMLEDAQRNRQKKATSN